MHLLTGLSYSVPASAPAVRRRRHSVVIAYCQRCKAERSQLGGLALALAARPQWTCGGGAALASRSLPHQPTASKATRRCSLVTASSSINGNHQLAGNVGVVIVDHGSRKKTSNEMLVHFGLLYQQMTGTQIVEIAHMEIAEPTIEQAIGKCAAAGADTVVVAPYFLSRGRHIQEDIPALVRAAQERYPSTKCIISEPIGIDPLMAQLIHNRVQSALATQAGSRE